jgi:hypothetical protein
MKPTRPQTTDAVATGVRRPLLLVICRWCVGARVSTLAKGPKGQRQTNTCRSSSALARRRDAAPVGRSIVQCLSPYRPASSCSLQHALQLMVASSNTRSTGSWQLSEGGKGTSRETWTPSSSGLAWRAPRAQLQFRSHTTSRSLTASATGRREPLAKPLPTPRVPLQHVYYIFQAWCCAYISCSLVLRCCICLCRAIRNATALARAVQHIFHIA